MQKKSYQKTFAALAITLVLGAGIFSTLNVKYAHAETSNSNSVSNIEQLQKTLESLLQKLISLLTNQIALLNTTKHSSDDKSSNDDDCATSTSNTSGLTELEAKIYTNETLIKVEYNGKKDLFTTSSTLRADIIEDVLAEYNTLTSTQVDDMLVVKTEDRASRASDKTWANSNGGVSGNCDDDSSIEDGDDDDDSGHDNGDDDDDDDDDDGGGHGDDDDDN